MPKLSNTQRRFLTEATKSYWESIGGSPAERILEERGIGRDVIDRYRLGYVESPVPGHEMYQGRIAIPYLRWSPGCGRSVVSIRFRCAAPDCSHTDHAKYATVSGDTPRMYNTPVLLEHPDIVCVTEGELDAIIATEHGIPAVGIPGANAWKSHFWRVLRGHEKVWFLADGDQPGKDGAAKIAKTLPNCSIIPMSDGGDVTTDILDHGAEWLREKIYK